MKHLYSAFFSFFVFSFSLQAQSTFNKYYGLNIQDLTAGAAVPLKDTGTLILGYGSQWCKGSKCKRSIFCVRLDKGGNPIFSKTFTDSTYSLLHPWCIVTAKAGFFIIAEARVPETSKDSGFVIIKCNKEGNILLSNRISTPEINGNTPVAIVSDSADNIMMVFNAGGAPRLIRINNKGQLVWGKAFVPAYDNLFSTSYSIYTVIEKDGNIYLGGSSSSPELDNNSSKGFVIGINKNGRGFLFRKFEKKRTIGYDFDSTAAAYNLFFEKNELFVYGHVMGKVCYFKVHDTVTSFIYSTPTTIFNPSSFGYFLLKHQEAKSYFGERYPDGGAPFLDYGSGLNLLKFDSLGRICPNFILQPYDTTTSTGSVQIYNAQYKSVVFAVNEVKAKVADSAFINKDSTVCSGEFNKRPIAANIVAISKKLIISIYPNPASNSISLNFNAEKDQQAIMQIFNNKGTLVKSERAFFKKGVNLKSINISQLSNGSYFLKLVNENTQEKFTFIKQQ
jgi:hypothetical protein